MAPAGPPAEDSSPLVPKQPAANAPTLTGELASFFTRPATRKLASFGLDPAARTRSLPPAAEGPSRILSPAIGFPIGRFRNCGSKRELVMGQTWPNWVKDLRA